MVKKIIFFVVSVLIFAICLPVAAVTHEELAQHWAPRIYHDTNDSYGYEAEYMTNFDYDGDWKGINNWNNLYNYPLKAYLYYNVVETNTHWFISYNAFHPRDDGPLLDAHENDFEGAVFAIKKDGSTHGSFHLLLTMAHGQWYQYTNDPNIRTAQDNVDGGVRFDQSGRPEIYIQANGSSLDGNGHGWHVYDGSSAPGGDGIVYYYGGWAEVPTAGDGNWSHQYSYALKFMDELWTRRLQYGDDKPYVSWGVFRGDDHNGKGENQANTPWVWDDPDDGPAFNGAAWSDPAHLIDTHLTGLGNWGRVYTANDCYTHKITVYDVTSLANRDPFGGKSDIYLKIYVNNQIYWDERLWKFDDAPIGDPKTVKMGKDKALVTTYDGDTNTIYVVQPAGSLVRIEVWDSDSTSGSDYMGCLDFTLQVGEVRARTQELTSNGEAAVSYYAECVQ